MDVFLVCMQASSQAPSQPRQQTVVHNGLHTVNSVSVLSVQVSSTSGAKSARQQTTVHKGLHALNMN